MALVKAWNTSFCGSLICRLRLAEEIVLRKPMSEMPSISIPSSTMTVPLESCSFRVLAGSWEVIHAGTTDGLKPKSSALKPCSTAPKGSFACPAAEPAPTMGAGAAAGGGEPKARAEPKAGAGAAACMAEKAGASGAPKDMEAGAVAAA